MKDAQSPLVVITGGSSGIGRATALLFARRGWRVGLIARGAEGLAASRHDVESAGAQVATAQADVADSAALRAAADAIVAALGAIELWINCAGNGVYGWFGDVPEAEFRRVTEVTYHGTINGTRIALDHMGARGRGRIINVCSATAFHGLPLMSSYAGAKAAVRAFGQAMQGELRLAGSPIRLGTVFPAAVNTPFFSHAVSHMGWPARPAPPVYQPEVVARGIWQAMRSGRPEMTIGGAATVFALATRLAPGLIGWCMARLGMQRQSTRDARAGRLYAPSLFAPVPRAGGVRGPFDAGARRWSIQLALFSLIWPRASARRPDAPPPPTPARQVPHRAPAGSVPPPGAA